MQSVTHQIIAIQRVFPWSTCMPPKTAQVLDKWIVVVVRINNVKFTIFDVVWHALYPIEKMSLVKKDEPSLQSNSGI